MHFFELLFLFFSIFLIFKIFLSFFSWLALWQRKEYRLDRLITHFQIKEGKRDLINFFHILAFLKKRPRFTLRIWLILLLTFVFFSRFSFFLLSSLVRLLLPFLEDQFFLSLFLTLLIFHFLTPLVIALGVFLTGVLVSFFEEFLFFLASAKLNKLSPLVIGITGSFGKTATKEILWQILKKKFKVLKTRGNENTKIGIALRIIKSLKHQGVFIVEMGAYRKGEIKSICQLVKPKIGILTGIDCQHQALFGDFGKIKKAKYELIQALPRTTGSQNHRHKFVVRGLPKDGLACFNVKNVYTRSLATKTKRIRVCLFGKGQKIKLPFWAKIYQENAQAALKVALSLKLTKEEVLKILENLKPFPNCLSVAKGRKDSVLLDDSYNASPTGFLRILDFIAKEYPLHKKLVVTPGIIELGETTGRVHQQIGEKIKALQGEFVLTKDNFKEDLEKGYGKKIRAYEDEGKLINFLRRRLKKDTLVLFEGRIPKSIILACQSKPEFKIKRIRNKKIWEDYVLNHPQVNFLHSFAWGRFQQKLGKKVLRLGVLKDKKLIGVASLIKEEAKRGTYLACPGGPLLKDWRGDDFHFLISYLKKEAAKQKVIFIRIRPQLFDNLKNRKIFKKEGFRDAPMHMHAENTWQLKLKPCEEELLKDMRKNTRYSIRKAKKMGVRVIKSQKLKDIEDFYKLQLQTAKRQHFAPFSLKFLKEQFKEFMRDSQVMLLKAEFRQKVIAMAFFIFYGKEAVYHYAATSELARKIPASYLIIWQAIKEAKKRGLEFFNFWGIASTDDPRHRFAGVTLFKIGFGGFRVDYLHAQDLPLTKRYFLTFIFESLRRLRRRL